MKFSTEPWSSVIGYPSLPTSHPPPTPLPLMRRWFSVCAATGQHLVMTELQFNWISFTYYPAHLLYGLWQHIYDPLKELCLIHLCSQYQHHACHMVDAHYVCVEWLWGSGRLRDRGNIESDLEKKLSRILTKGHGQECRDKGQKNRGIEESGWSGMVRSLAWLVGGGRWGWKAQLKQILKDLSDVPPTELRF